MRGSRIFCRGGGGGVQAPQLILQFTEGVQWFYYTFSRGVQLFPGGVQLLISIETHLTITCDFPGGSGPPIPPLDPHMDNVAFWHEKAQTSLCCLLFSLETSNANRPIVFKRLTKALIRLRICAGWSKPLVLAYTTLLEISYCGPFFGAKMHYGCISG